MSTTSALQPTSSSRPLVSRLCAYAPLLLGLSVAARFALIYLHPQLSTMIDLHVYVGGAGALDHPGTLYSYVYTDQDPKYPLPFTYPPFAAVLFYPLHLVPFDLLFVLWTLATITALYASIRIGQRLLGIAGQDRSRRLAMLWTAISIWTEPVASTVEYGQVNVFLMLAVLGAVYVTRWWLSGLLVGVAAGVKLTPAFAGIYFVGVRRWGAALFSAVVFFATVAVSVLVIGEQARYYFTDLLGDAHRIGPVGTASNQSWRGGISRILGHDAGYGPLVLAAIAVTAVLAVLAWRALDESDLLGKLLVVELFGLLASPISWTHHWVWLVPLLVWLVHGPLRQVRGARILAWSWLVLALTNITPALNPDIHNLYQFDRPWYLACAGLIYIVPALVSLTWIAARRRILQTATSPTTAAA